MKALVVLSGGMDSTVVLAHAIHNFGKKEVATITFNYGSKHNARENAAAKAIAKHYGVSNVLVRLPFIGETFKSDLLKRGGKIPLGHYADPSMKRTVVPFRNGIMLAIAAGYAESIGASFLYLGNHAGDHAIYPDCREEFAKGMKIAIAAGTYKNVILRTPFITKTKTQIAADGAKLKAPFALTYSCYQGKRKHCGQCGTCYERREAFRESHVADPTPYSHATN